MRAVSLLVNERGRSVYQAPEPRMLLGLGAAVTWESSGDKVRRCSLKRTAKFVPVMGGTFAAFGGSPHEAGMTRPKWLDRAGDLVALVVVGFIAS